MNNWSLDFIGGIWIDFQYHIHMKIELWTNQFAFDCIIWQQSAMNEWRNVSFELSLCDNLPIYTIRMPHWTIQLHISMLMCHYYQCGTSNVKRDDIFRFAAPIPDKVNEENSIRGQSRWIQCYHISFPSIFSVFWMRKQYYSQSLARLKSFEGLNEERAQCRMSKSRGLNNQWLCYWEIDKW